jgi:hypothetical protein
MNITACIQLQRYPFSLCLGYHGCGESNPKLILSTAAAADDPHASAATFNQTLLQKYA